MRGERLEYTEKEKKGIDKVERMNKIFDKIILPAVGVLIAVLLFFFVVGKYREKFCSESKATAETSGQLTEPKAFSLRRSLMAEYGEHKKEFEAYGYVPVDGFSYDVSLCKTVDKEMSVFQFADRAIGELTVISYIPKSKDTAYDSLSVAFSSYRLITVTAKRGEESCSVTFLSYDFTSYKSGQEEQFDALMKLTDIDEILAMREIFETDIFNLARTCKG